MLSALARFLGLDLESLNWYYLAMCKGMDRELFYDQYEADESIARNTDQICLSCPVLKECLSRGIENGEYGVWGGVYLNAGKPDDNRNSHKTPDVWMELRDRIGDVL